MYYNIRQQMADLCSLPRMSWGNYQFQALRFLCIYFQMFLCIYPIVKKTEKKMQRNILMQSMLNLKNFTHALLLTHKSLYSPLCNLKVSQFQHKGGEKVSIKLFFMISRKCFWKESMCQS